MKKQCTPRACVDVRRYPPELLRLAEDGAHVAATYRSAWDDGFGARGWKINAAIGDPVIIASTRETGRQINTSVFIHDILDHFLSGFGVSGHRSEAMALVQLSARTGSDPVPDYEQMAREDIINGIVNGESLLSFLPGNLRQHLPDSPMPDKERMDILKRKLGQESLVEQLVEHFFTLGKAGEKHARESWCRLGLEPVKKTGIGVALQHVLEEADRLAETSGAEHLQADITVSNGKCSLAQSGHAVAARRFSMDVC